MDAFETLTTNLRDKGPTLVNISEAVRYILAVREVKPTILNDRRYFLDLSTAITRARAKWETHASGAHKEVINNSVRDESITHDKWKSKLENLIADQVDPNNFIEATTALIGLLKRQIAIDRIEVDLLLRAAKEEFQLYGCRKNERGTGTHQEIPALYFLQRRWLDVIENHLSADLVSVSDKCLGLEPNLDWWELSMNSLDLAKLITAESEPPQPTKKENRGRKKGSGSFDKTDNPLIDEMNRLVESGEFASPHAAAHDVADRAKGSGAIESKVARLTKKYGKRFRSN